MPSASSSTGASPAVTCPSCQTQAPAGSKFCPTCGAALGSVNCAACGAGLTPGAKFCHRCGTPVGIGAAATSHLEQRSFNSALPWGVAAIALVALVALVAGQRFGGSHSPSDGAAPQGAADAAPFAGATGNGQAPDISNLTPAEAAVRLYNRVMSAHERGRADTVQMFAPMAMMAYEQIGKLDLDQRYDLGRIAAVSGDQELARAEADTILALHPNHLLGLILAGNAARMRKDTAGMRAYHDKLVAAAATERAKQLPEYVAHDNDIALALSAPRP